MDKRLAELLSILLTYLAGWLKVDAPVSVVNTKFGFIPSRETCKINPHHEVYAVLTNILTIVNHNKASSLLNESVSSFFFLSRFLVSLKKNVLIVFRHSIQSRKPKNR